MTTLKTIKVYKDEICNLSRIPLNMRDNPCYKTSMQIIKSLEINEELSFKHTELYNHYQTYNPKTMFDLYGIVERLSEYPFSRMFLPWIYAEPLKNQIDVAFISPQSNNNYSSDNFTQNQVKKLRTLIKSFKELGYSPNLFPDRKKGHVTGYFLKNKNRKRFYIVSGNHRASVFYALFPDQALPVIYENSKFAKARELEGRNASDFLKTYDCDNVFNWPAVKSGFLKAEEALSIAEVYLNV